MIDLRQAVSDDVFEEYPVHLKEFLYSSEYLGLPELSRTQEQVVEKMTQIYKRQTLIEAFGRSEADRLWPQTYNEIILELGKGSGKDFIISIAFARIVYLLLCLRDPSGYYGKPPGDSIALLNVAINAKQAQEVFFKYFKQRIKGCNWYSDKIVRITADKVEFDKEITAYSGHSQREAWEGYNLLVVVLDEIAAFATEAESTGNPRADTAEAIYEMYQFSVTSRFSQFGKLALLSWPRFKGDFIETRYNDVVGQKHTEIKSHTFVIHDDLDPHDPSNQFTIHWEEDHITAYIEPNVYALRRPTWEVNPTVDIEDFKAQFIRNYEEALSRLACMPPDALDALFKDHEKIRQAFPIDRHSPFRPDWSTNELLQPSDFDYYLHVDLAYSHDRAAVAMAHVEDWVKMSIGNNRWMNEPVVKLDLVRWWTPTRSQNVNIDEIQQFIIKLKQAGFNLKLVTYDRWNSASHRQTLQRDFNIPTDLLSVAKEHYDDLVVVINTGRLIGYDIPLARDEFKGLQIIKGNKVDHPSKGSKDVADAICGAVYNSVNHTPKNLDNIIEVRYLGKQQPERPTPQPKPKRAMPDDLRRYLDKMQVIE